MHLELKGEEKFGFDDQQDKTNRNFRKEERHSKGGGGNPKLITNCEEVRNDHALQHAVPESEGRAFHQMEKVLHQNRKATQSTAVKHS